MRRESRIEQERIKLLSMLISLSFLVEYMVYFVFAVHLLFDRIWEKADYFRYFKAIIILLVCKTTWVQ